MDWMKKGVWSLLHLVDISGCIMSYEHSAITALWTLWLKPTPTLWYVSSKDVWHILPHHPLTSRTLIVGYVVNGGELPNKTIRNLFNDIVYSIMSYRNSILQIYLKRTVPNTSQSQRNIFFKCVSVSIWWFGIETSVCVFCGRDKTSDHLFVQCMCAEASWLDVCDWLYPKLLWLDVRDVTGFTQRFFIWEILLKRTLLVSRTYGLIMDISKHLTFWQILLLNM